MATDSAAISLCHEVILKALKTTPRGSAPGPSGMQFEHLKPCLDSCELCDLLCEVVQCGVRNPPPNGDWSSIGGCLSYLISQRKNGDVRLIAVGECLRHLCACCISSR